MRHETSVGYSRRNELNGRSFCDAFARLKQEMPDPVLRKRPDGID